MNPTQILEMKFEDLERVTELADQLGYANSLEDLRFRFQKISQLPQYALFVAKAADGKVVGWIQVNEETHSLLVGTKAEITALVVDQSVRSQGIGAELVRKAEQWALANGLDLMRVRSNVKREAAHRFYQRENYILNKTGHIFTKRLQD